MDNEAIKAAVDELGDIVRQERRLAKRKAQLRGLIVEAAQSIGPKLMADRYSATIVHATRAVVDWRSVADHFAPSRQLVTAHTTVTDTVSVRTTLIDN